MISFFEWVQESSWTYNCRKCINPADAAASPCVQRQHENLCETSGVLLGQALKAVDPVLPLV